MINRKKISVIISLLIQRKLTKNQQVKIAIEEESSKRKQDISLGKVR